MQWDRNLSNLRDILAGLYWDRNDIVRVMQDTGFNPGEMRLSDKSLNTWHFFLEEAMHQGKVQEIIAIARKKYPDLQSLALAEQQQLLAIEIPEILDGSWDGPEDAGTLEQIIGAQSTLLPVHFLERGQQMARAVARIECADKSRGTGFLIRDNLLITNSHVIASEADALHASAQFNVQQTPEGREAPIDKYQLLPSEGFLNSPKDEEGGDDWTVVRVAGNPNERWGTIPLHCGKSETGGRAIIIQHPGGGQKQIAFYHNVIVAANDRRIQYLTDTLEGSSGSPVFNNEWQLLAVHHKGGQHEPNSKANKWRNQGVNIQLVLDAIGEAGI